MDANTHNMVEGCFVRFYLFFYLFFILVWKITNIGRALLTAGHTELHLGDECPSLGHVLSLQRRPAEKMTPFVM